MFLGQKGENTKKSLRCRKKISLNDKGINYVNLTINTALMTQVDCCIFNAFNQPNIMTV